MLFGSVGVIASDMLPVMVPASVISLLLLLAALRLKLLPEAMVNVSADFLTANMGFFFVPVTVNIIDNYDAFAKVLPQVIIVCVVSTLCTFAATYFTASVVRKLIKKGQQ